jgi:hypothetical protein
MNASPPDYNAVYFDSNELLANGWPDPSPRLGNFFDIGRGWNLRAFIPAPVLDETEAHWWRAVESQATRLTSAKREFERLSRPIMCDVRIELTDIEEMRTQYRVHREEILKSLNIGVVPYPNCTVEFFFQRATNYAMPFEKDREGKGFQDAVILQSILEHLHSESELKGVLITRDGGMTQARIADFLPQLGTSRLRFATLDEAWDNLIHYHIDQKVIQPYHEELKNALAAVKKLDPELKDFLATHLTEPMLRAGELGAPATVLKLISVDSIDVSFVDTPVPDLDANPDRTVKILISISAQCTAVARKESFGFFSSLFGGSEQASIGSTSPPEVFQGKASWSGGIRATAKVVNRQFQEIVPEAVVSNEELRTQK